MAGNVTIQLVGVERLVRKTSSGELTRKPITPALRRLASKAAAVVAAGAPRKSGQLSASVKGAPLGKFAAIVRVTATRSSKKYPRYRYPKRLNYDPRLRTAGWLDDLKPRIEAAVSAEANAIAREIEREWQAN